MNKFFYLLIFCFSVSCCTNSSNNNSSFSTEKNDEIIIDSAANENMNKFKNSNKLIDSTLLLSNLIDVRTLNKNIFVDLKYASEDNFMKIRLYYTIDRAFLQKDVAERLAKCQEYLSTIDTNLHLLVYDAVRPLSVQYKMWKALDSIPVKERVKFVSNPKSKSIHNYGAAVDLTICNSKGIPLDMGAGYDDIREIAYPSLEAKFLVSGELTQSNIDNRILLRKVMRSQNFRNIPTEWWHFNACSRAEAALKYNVLENEP